MEKATADYLSVKYAELPYGEIMHNADYTSWLYFQKKADGEPLRAIVHPLQMSKENRSLNILPMQAGEDLETFGMASIIAQLPEIQAEAAEKILTKEEYEEWIWRTLGIEEMKSPEIKGEMPELCDDVVKRTFGIEEMKSPEIKGEMPELCDDVVKRLTNHMPFRVACQLWAKDEQAADLDRCWPPTFGKSTEIGNMYDDMEAVLRMSLDRTYRTTKYG